MLLRLLPSPSLAFLVFVLCPALDTASSFKIEIQKPQVYNALPCSTSLKPRVAVCLYGLISRSLKYTHKSIEENIVHALEEEGYEVDLFAHSFKLHSLTNPRSFELEKQLNTSDVFHLKYTDYMVENQTLVDNYLNFHVFEKFGSAWQEQRETNFHSLRNILRQLYSLRLSWHVMNRYANNCKHNYTAVILARPDCYYEQKVTIRSLELRDDLVHLPYYDNIEQQFNDRFAIATVRGSYIVSHRLESALAFCEGKTIKPLHSESLVYFHLTQQNITANIFPFQFCRIRAGGVVVKDYCKDVDAINRHISLSH